MQDVAIAVLRQRGPLQDMTRVAPWLYRVAIRQVLQYRRTNGRRAGREARFAQRNGRADTARGEDPLQWIIAVETRQQLMESLDALSGQDRELLMLRHAEGWTYAQIAEQLGLDFDKVVYRLGRAKRRLRSVWLAGSKS